MMFFPCDKKTGVCAHHIYLVVFLFIVTYGYYVRVKSEPDVLETKFASCDGCDYWAGTHFLLNALLAFTLPDHVTLFFVVGSSYEVFEQLVGQTDNAVQRLGPRSDGVQTWWYGRFSDILFNTTGLLVGLLLRTLV